MRSHNAEKEKSVLNIKFHREKAFHSENVIIHLIKASSAKAKKS